MTPAGTTADRVSAIASASTSASTSASASAVAHSAGNPAASAATAAASAALHAFAGIGIELEHIIVARGSLDPLPIADRLLAAAGGPGAADVVRGSYGWSNELALHVIEMKNQAPVASLAGLVQGFNGEVEAINRLLAQFDACLLPGGMHPWMRPAVDTVLWPHENAEIYQHFDRLFDCRRHGWANLQSMHVNLPFSGDDEFARLHAAIRLVLPIIPALAASSPFADGVDSGHADYRMMVYRDNAALVPEIAGAVIPDTVVSREAYGRDILAPIYRAMAPHDPHGVLRHEWLNSRGAIARFDRSAIEIRVTDTQECPLADIAIAGAITAVVRMLYDEETATLAQQQAFHTTDLVDILGRCTDRAELAPLTGTACSIYLGLLGYPKFSCSAQHLWRYLLRVRAPEPGLGEEGIGALDQILEHGTLATRLRRATHGDVTPARLHTLYRKLADCLQQGRMFGGQRVL